MRAFIALEISRETRTKLGEAIGLLKPHTFKVKWAKPEQVHVTLKFFADLNPELLGPVGEAVSSVARSTASFEYTVQGLGSFGSGGRMRVLWCGVSEGGEGLRKLQGSVENCLEPLGFPGEGRPFSAHLTLGRLREPSRELQLEKALERSRDFLCGRERAREMVLFRSDLTPAGPVYTPQQRWGLEGLP